MDTRIAASRPVNNAVYDTLGDRWYTANDDPVALLRAESKLHVPWVASRLCAEVGSGARVLDVGCGAGFLSNPLAERGFRVFGLDASANSLRVARAHDSTRGVDYRVGDARALPFPKGTFDAVCAMDFLEHVEEPDRVIAEAARVLRPGGLFLFHTFNRNVLAWLVVIKGVEWFVENTPENLHVLRLFLKPAELAELCARHGLSVVELLGSEPVIWSRAFFRLLATHEVPVDFRFHFTRSTRIAYIGYARAGAASR
jgi:2-polyprenyl-6-hydroxyphenyl methylase/3-demethylubiquinone-9 3-methyltransferase